MYKETAEPSRLIFCLKIIRLSAPFDNLDIIKCLSKTILMFYRNITRNCKSYEKNL